MPGFRASTQMLLSRVATLIVLAAISTVGFAETKLRRTTLLVNDIGRSIEFYHALGLRHFFESEKSQERDGGVIGGGDLPLAGAPSASRIVILIGPDDDTGMIGLLAYGDPSLASARAALEGVGQGDTILMFSVDDLQETYRKLREIGVRFHRKPYRYEVVDQSGRLRSTGWRMFAYDPDGRLIEIAQRDSSEQRTSSE